MCAESCRDVLFLLVLSGKLWVAKGPNNRNQQKACDNADDGLKL